MKDYFVVDIETCPLDISKCMSLADEDRQRMINPIDSRIVALGIRHQGQNKIFLDDNEKEMLENFWREWSNIKRGDDSVVVIGFNITNFDLPFIVTRSLIHNVTIVPFILKTVVDLREKISAYRYGPTRGTLKEFASFLNIPTPGLSGSDVLSLCVEKNYNMLRNYLTSDLEVTDALFQRIRDTKILNIGKW